MRQNSKATRREQIPFLGQIPSLEEIPFLLQIPYMQEFVQLLGHMLEFVGRQAIELMAPVENELQQGVEFAKSMIGI